MSSEAEDLDFEHEEQDDDQEDQDDQDDQEDRGEEEDDYDDDDDDGDDNDSEDKKSNSIPTSKKSRKEQREKKKFDFERNDRTIFVGNLPSTMDHRDVEKLFKSCGPIESARIRSIVPEKEKLPPKVALITQRIHPKVDSVNAYVVFAKTGNDDCIKKALAMNGKVLEKHHIRVDRAQRPNSKRMTLTSRKKSVFVGNLRFDLRDDDLIAHFAKAGEVEYVRLVRDRATGLGKGFGFVKFMERAAVKEALKLNDTDFKGRQLRVKKIDEKTKLADDTGPSGRKPSFTPDRDKTNQKQNKGQPKQSTGYERRQLEKNQLKKQPQQMDQSKKQAQPRNGDRPKQGVKQEKRVKFDLEKTDAKRTISQQSHKTKVNKKDKKRKIAKIAEKQKTILKKKIQRGMKS